ncbi:MAG: GntR family transcriptional regulator [Leucobacter sp.]|nr:GntR family transcriptional regulator [Leucobacter sp.]
MQQSSFTTSAPSRSAADAPLLDRLRGLIVSGVVPPGDLLGETALAEEFEVSRTPIREALKQLEREGLVEIRPRVGTFVRKPSQREIYELFQLKESLEGLAAGLLAQRGDVPELRSLIRNVESEHDVVRAGDRAAYSTLVHDFHHTLIAGADNQKLSEHYELLMNQLAYHRIVTQTLALPGRLDASLGEHQQIVLAIQSKDPITAELATRRHVAQTRENAALAAFREDGASPSN